jgi:hypothetical protein
MIHQHGFGHATTLKGLLQLGLHQAAVQLACRRKRDQVAAVVVQDRKWADTMRPVLWPLKVHLPQLVGPFAFKTLDGLLMTVLFPHHPVAQQDAMDGAAG